MGENSTSTGESSNFPMQVNVSGNTAAELSKTIVVLTKKAERILRNWLSVQNFSDVDELNRLCGQLREAVEEMLPQYRAEFRENRCLLAMVRAQEMRHWIIMARELTREPVRSAFQTDSEISDLNSRVSKSLRHVVRELSRQRRQLEASIEAGVRSGTEEVPSASSTSQEGETVVGRNESDSLEQNQPTDLNNRFESAFDQAMQQDSPVEIISLLSSSEENDEVDDFIHDSYDVLRRSLQRVRNESDDRFEGNQADNDVPHSENDSSWERIESDEDFRELPEEHLDIFFNRLRMIENLEDHLEENGRVGGRLGENNRVGGRFEDLIQDFEEEVLPFTDSEDEDENKDEDDGLSAERIERFHHFDAGADLAGEQCQICMSELQADTRMVRLDCHENHIMCTLCTNKWFGDHKTCPLCRKSF